MMGGFRPSHAQELAESVAAAAAHQRGMELVSGGSRRPRGRPLQVAHMLDVSALAGIVAYEPSELVLTAGAATPLAEIEAMLAGANQMLAFEPADWGRLLGG